MRKLTKSSSVLLVLAGIALGCTAAAVAPETVAWNSPASAAGSWECFRAHDFPDVADAKDDKEAKNTAAGLNAIAPDTPAGTILTIQAETSMAGRVYSDAVCVKR